MLLAVACGGEPAPTPGGSPIPPAPPPVDAPSPDQLEGAWFYPPALAAAVDEARFARFVHWTGDPTAFSFPAPGQVRFEEDQLGAKLCDVAATADDAGYALTVNCRAGDQPGRWRWTGPGRVETDLHRLSGLGGGGAAEFVSLRQSYQDLVDTYEVLFAGRITEEMQGNYVGEGDAVLSIRRDGTLLIDNRKRKGRVLECLVPPRDLRTACLEIEERAASVVFAWLPDEKAWVEGVFPGFQDAGRVFEVLEVEEILDKAWSEDEGKAREPRRYRASGARGEDG